MTTTTAETRARRDAALAAILALGGNAARDVPFCAPELLEERARDLYAARGLPYPPANAAAEHHVEEAAGLGGASS